VNEYVPLGSAKAILPVVELWVEPASASDQEVPGGSPNSVNVTG